MDIGQSNWSETDASNTTAAPDGMPEGMAPSGVNDWGRAVAGAVKRWFNRSIPKTTAGTTTAYTLTYTVAPTSLVDGETYLVRFNATNGAAPTLNINALGAVPIHRYSSGAWAAVAAGDLTANMICRLSYNLAAGAFYITSTSVTAIGAAFLTVANAFTGANTFAGTSAFNGTVTMGAAINETAVIIATASTVDIGAAAANTIHLTGTTTVTAFGTAQSGARRNIIAGGAFTLTHNATSMILPTGASVAWVAGDCFEMISEGAGNWRLTDYALANGRALAVVTPVNQIVAMCKGTGIVRTKQFNVASITKNSTGDYSFNFTANIDADAVISAVAYSPGGSSGDCVVTAQSASAVRVVTYNAGGSPADFDAIHITAHA